jgi:putative transposase
MERHLPLGTPRATLVRQAGPGHVFSNHAGRTGFVLQEAICAGHQYEVDSTQADVWLVSAKDSNKIIGKPTLYFIIDRFSRRVVEVVIGPCRVTRR